MKAVTIPNGSLTLAGNLYLPEGFSEDAKYPTVVVSHPGGGVKEQAAGLYAKKLAENGLIAIAFDRSYQGESTGTPRQMENPYVSTEDVSAVIDYLTTLPYVDQAGIGAMGICAGGGYSANAAINDRRIKAVGTVSAVNIGQMFRNGWENAVKDADAMGLLEMGSNARTSDTSKTELATLPLAPLRKEDAPNAELAEAWEYYHTPRCEHPNAPGFMLARNLTQLVAYDACNKAEAFLTQPILCVVGSAAGSKWMSDDLLARAASTDKAMHVVEGANHMSLYDVPKCVDEAVSKLAPFFLAKLEPRQAPQGTQTAPSSGDTEPSTSNIKSVTYRNLGWETAADIYLPPGFDASKKYPAIVSTHPVGSCKEQTAGNVYAKGLAQEGFVVLVHDASFQGASGGTPRFIEDPAIRVSDIRFAVDYLQSLPYVDADRIGGIGVCGGGAYTVHAGITDHRLKALVSITGVNYGRLIREAFAQFKPRELAQNIAQMRASQAQGGERTAAGLLPASVDAAKQAGVTDIDVLEATEYYKTARGQKPHGATSQLMSFSGAAMGWDAFTNAEVLLTQPLMVVIGGKPGGFGAYLDGWEVYSRAASENKHIVVAEGWSHYDLYDKPEPVDLAMAKVVPFFKDNL